MQPHSVACKSQQTLLLLLALTAAISYCTRAEASTTSVCPYQTANYITHSLPQLCLATSRSARLETSQTEAFGSSGFTSRISTPLTTPTSLNAPDTASARAADFTDSGTEVPAVVENITSTVASEESDSESPLGNDHFLSFEEWKKRNLDKYGQSSDQIGKPKRHETLQPRRQPINVLDSLGDEAEIDLDFTGFAAEKPQIAVPTHGMGLIRKPEECSREVRSQRLSQGEAKMLAQPARNASTTRRSTVLPLF